MTWEVARDGTEWGRRAVGAGGARAVMWSEEARLGTSTGRNRDGSVEVGSSCGTGRQGWVSHRGRTGQTRPGLARHVDRLERDGLVAWLGLIRHVEWLELNRRGLSGGARQVAGSRPVARDDGARAGMVGLRTGIELIGLVRWRRSVVERMVERGDPA